MNIQGESADSIESLYNAGRISKKDVTAWVRLSAKLSGRIYHPQYRSGARHDRLWLRRREDLEEKLFAKKGGYWRGKRDPRSRSRRDVDPMPKRDKHVEQAFLLGVLEAMWLDSYMDWADEHGYGHTTGHIPQHVRDLSDIPQAPPLAAKKLAKKYVSILVKINRASVTELWARASRADGREADPRELGFYLAMQSRGHGVGWTDSHVSFKVVIPNGEWYAYGSKGRVDFEGYVSEKFKRWID